MAGKSANAQVTETERRMAATRLRYTRRMAAVMVAELNNLMEDAGADAVTARERSRLDLAHAHIAQVVRVLESDALADLRGVK